MGYFEKPKRVTRNDVAKLAGVSPAVVSYVINKSKFVSEEKTNAVLDAIRELNYHPNIQARGLKTNRSMQVAFVGDNLRNDWLVGAERILSEQGYYVSNCYSRDGEDFIQMLIDRQFDGVFMMSNRFSAAQLNAISDAGIPIVLYKTKLYKKLNGNIVTVVPDLKDAVSKSVDFLAMRGHKRIALIPPLRYKTGGIGDEGVRIQAYEEAMHRNGLEVRPEWICTATETEEDIMNSIFNMIVSGEPDLRPNALVVGNDYLAVHVMQYIKRLGFRIPEDVAVIGSDNSYLASLVTPPLTTIDFSKEEFSQKMAHTLLELMAGRSVEDQIIKVSIVVRESA